MEDNIDEANFRRITITYRVYKDSMIFSKMNSALDAIFGILNCRIVHTKDEPIEDSEVPRR